MAGRQEEKEQRRKERLEREEGERRAAARRKRLQYVFGGLLAVAAVGGIVAVLALGVLGGDDGGGGPGDPQSASEAPEGVTLPEQKIGELKAAAEAAGCKVENPEIEGSTHESKDFKASDYKTNPPTSGNHAPDWYEDGIYAAGDAPELGMQVHTLEHGRVDVQYKEGTAPEDVTKLEAFLAETDGYHLLLFENTTGMESAVAATAWGQSLTCDKLDDTTWDALRNFRTSYIDKGPEAVP